MRSGWTGSARADASAVNPIAAAATPPMERLSADRLRRHILALLACPRPAPPPRPSRPGYPARQRLSSLLSSLPGEDKVAVLDRHLGLAHLLSRERPAQELARERRQQRIGDDVVDHAPARVGIVALRHDVIDHRRFIG